jgi:hypothetical protein
MIPIFSWHYFTHFFLLLPFCLEFFDEFGAVEILLRLPYVMRRIVAFPFQEVLNLQKKK